jgi:hypothetical protein
MGLPAHKALVNFHDAKFLLSDKYLGIEASEKWEVGFMPEGE